MSNAGQILDVLNIPAESEHVYRVLLRNPGITLVELRALCALPPAAFRAALTAVEAHGLVSRAPGNPVRLIAVPPESAVAPLIARRQRELLDAQQAVERVRHAASMLQREYLAALQATNPGELVEVVRGRDAVLERNRQLQTAAEREVLAMSAGSRSADAGPWQINQAQLDRMAAGVKYRCIYEREFIEREGGLERVATYVTAGEEARIISSVPMRLSYIDDDVALVPLERANQLAPAVVVHRSALLDALRALFECCWDAATPIILGDDGEPRVKARQGPSPTDRRILVLLAGGSKDEAIARQLGLSLTTVRRRVGAMLQALGAETRFQAGINAVRRGWIPPA